MMHGLNRQFLYSAVKIDTTFVNGTGTLKTVTGTAFFAKIAERMLLVTNRHVLEAHHRNAKFVGFKLVQVDLTGRFSGDALTQLSLVEPVDVLFHANRENDVAAIDCGTANIKAASKVTVDYFVGEPMIATSEHFKDDIGVCDFVAFPGYPMWHDQVENRPIFRVGTIASDPSQNYHFGSGEGALGGECIAYEAFSYGGSSGSPVFALQKGIRPGEGLKLEGFRDARLVGVNGGHLPATDTAHSGMSYFYKSSLLFELA